MFNNKKIHLIGIGGISMSSIALMLLNMNAQVSGSDIQESNLTKNLEEKGVKIKYGHHPEMVHDADIVVYTAAICKDDPERIAIKNENKENYERAEFLGMMMKEFKHSLCVSGTHGKSTTTAMLSLIFLEANLNPTIQVGAILPEINGNTHLGNHDYFIMEACEYVDSFLHFHPTSAIITNIDNDHLDYFKNLGNIKKSFYKYVSLLPEDGYLIKNNDDENSNELDKHTNATVITYGINNNANFMAKNITCNHLGHYSYDIYLNNELLTTINLNINGKHNIYNSLAAFALAYQYIKDINVIKNALEKYHGVGRRFEFLGTYKGALIYDDYAHHPTEIEATLHAAKNYPHKKIWCVFQPHTYTRTKALLPEFAKALTLADHVVLADIYAARETDNLGISSRNLQEKIVELGTPCEYFPTFDEIENFLFENCTQGDLLITMGAGDVVNIGEQLLGK